MSTTGAIHNGTSVGRPASLRHAIFCRCGFDFGPEGMNGWLGSGGCIVTAIGRPPQRLTRGSGHLTIVRHRPVIRGGTAIFAASQVGAFIERPRPASYPNRGRTDSGDRRRAD